MRKALPTALVGILATLVLTSSAAFAVQVDVEVDKRIVSPGGTLTVSGTVTDDEGNPGVFEYRVAAIAPGQRNGGERIIICDSDKQTTGDDGAVSFECEIPTIGELESLGVQSAGERSVIPIKGGISAKDAETGNETKKHGTALIVNTQKIQDKLEAMLERLDSFIAKSQELIAKCDNITARAEQAGADSVIDRCAAFQENMQMKIDSALGAQERINNAIANLDDPSTIDFRNLGSVLNSFRDGARDFRSDVGQLRNFVSVSRADLEKRVADEIVNRTRERAQDLRENIQEREDALRERISDVRQIRADRIQATTAVNVRTTASSEVDQDE